MLRSDHHRSIIAWRPEPPRSADQPACANTWSAKSYRSPVPRQGKQRQWIAGRKHATSQLSNNGRLSSGTFTNLNKFCRSAPQKSGGGMAALLGTDENRPAMQRQFASLFHLFRPLAVGSPRSGERLFGPTDPEGIRLVFRLTLPRGRTTTPASASSLATGVHRFGLEEPSAQAALKIAIA